MKARCEGGVFYVDMSNYLNQQSTDAYKDMEMSVEGGNLEMPSGMKAGDALEGRRFKDVFFKRRNDRDEHVGFNYKQKGRGC